MGGDVRGGTQVELGFEVPAYLNQVRDVLSESGLDNPGVVLFGSDTEVLIRTQESMEDQERQRIERRLQEINPNATVTDVRRGSAEMVDLLPVVEVSGDSAGQCREPDTCF